jgi:uncharacterized membrane protein YjgN (DUF898 family)
MSENESLTHNDNQNLIISEESKSNFLEISKWAQFLAILGFVGLAFMVIGSLFMSMFSGAMPRGAGMEEFQSEMPFALMSVLYLVIAVVYYFPLRYLFDFASKMKQGITDNDQANTDMAISKLKRHYKFIGIFTIIILSIYLLVFLGGIIAAIAIGR